MAFLSQILVIILINLALSGDNAVVIGMAAHRLEPKLRKRAILIGGCAAIVLRIMSGVSKRKIAHGSINVVTLYGSMARESSPLSPAKTFSAPPVVESVSP